MYPRQMRLTADTSRLAEDGRESSGLAASGDPA